MRPFLERAFVQEELDALAGGQLAALVLGLDALGAAALSALFLQLVQASEAVGFLLDCHAFISSFR